MHPLSRSNMDGQKNMVGQGNVDRRQFLVATAATATVASATWNGFSGSEAVASTTLASKKCGPIYKTLKWGMVKVKGSVEDKFRAVKAAGYQGIEIDCPGADIEAVKKAIAATGLPVDGSVCSTHWDIRHSSPDATTREKALEDLRTALRQTHAVGGHTVLLVVGKGEDGPEKDIWPRSVENIRKAVPLAAELGVHIAIENVWNQFLYDHGGDANQTAEKFVKYVDEFESPWVGMQFDIGNHWKYGNPGDWIRTLGKRIVKLDIKGFSRATGKFTDISKGDIDWKGVRDALADIGFIGWCAAEVAGGDQERLTQIAKEIDSVLELA